MKLLNIIFTYNRPNIQKYFFESLKNTKYPADHTVIIDDGSEKETQEWLANYAKDNGFEILLKPKNEGYSRAWLDGYAYVKKYQPNYVFFLESDYLFRRDYMEECYAVFDELKELWGICGFSHPEWDNRDKIIPWFSDTVFEQYGKRINSLPNIYKLFDLDTRIGKIQCRYGTHCCGTFLLNWRRLTMNGRVQSPIDVIMNRGANFGEYHKVINDGMITGGISLLWDQVYNAARERNDQSAFIDICDTSIGAHVSGDGENAKGTPEGQSNVGVRSFPLEYWNFKR